jgi:hypothetical protein
VNGLKGLLLGVVHGQGIESISPNPDAVLDTWPFLRPRR